VPLECRRLTAAAHLDHGAISNERHVAALATQHTLSNLRRHTMQMVSAKPRHWHAVGVEPAQ
jgi:hypothetical protein